MQYYRNFQLKAHNSFRLNSIAKEIWFPENSEELSDILRKLHTSKVYILGGGTNVIMNSKIEKIISLKKMERYFLPLSENRVLVSASYLTTEFINKITQLNKTGVEKLIGIPGLIGGAIVMNAGSGDACISDFLLGCNIVTATGDRTFILKKALDFKRRYSNLQDTKEIITSAVFEFKTEGVNIELINQAQKYRKTLPKYPSAGGIFINWHELRPFADKLIGLNEEGATVSKKINIIINKNKATFDNIMNLITKIKTIVNKDLYLEVKIFGA